MRISTDVSDTDIKKHAQVGFLVVSHDDYHEKMSTNEPAGAVKSYNLH